MHLHNKYYLDDLCPHARSSFLKASISLALFPIQSALTNVLL